LRVLDFVLPPGFVIFADSAYALTHRVQRLHKTSQLNTDEKKTFNMKMSRVRVSIEWYFGYVCQLWQWVSTKRCQQLLKRPVALFFIVAVWLTNCATCARGGNQVSKFFECDPMDLNQYLILSSAM